MIKVSNNKNEEMPKIAFVFTDLAYGGSNLQTVKIIQHSGAVNNCIVITLVDVENDTDIEDKLIEMGIRPIHLHFEKRKLFFGLARLRHTVMKNQCQIVNSNGLRSDMACHYAFQGTDISHIITLHNYLREDAFLRMNRSKAMLATIMQTHVLRRSKHVIACSKTLQRQTEADIKGVKVTAIQNGVDPEEYPVMDKEVLRKQYFYPEDALIFISTGSMTLRKRIPETVDAFIRADLPNAKLLMVGNGPYLEEYKERYAQNKAVIFLGRRCDIKELLNISDVFVSSSESEGLPLAVLEAVSTHNYLCMSDIPQHKEVLDELEDVGELYHIGKVDELSELLKRASNKVKDFPQTSLKNTSLDIRIMGEKYRDYYCSVGNISKKIKHT